MRRRLSRRRFLKTVGAAMVLYLPAINTPLRTKAPGPSTRMSFTPIPATSDDRLHVAPGHTARVLLSWGDPILPGAPPFDPERQTAAGQALQFGYNCDFVGFMPLPRGGMSSEQGLLVVNHEFTNPELMFREFGLFDITREQVDIQLAAHGMTVVEIRCDKTDGWQIVPDSPYARRITGTTECIITGPAADHHLVRSVGDGLQMAIGTLANCSAGRTPWGTVLSAEENWHLYFANRDDVNDEGVRLVHARYGLPRKYSQYGFEKHHDRFDLGKHPKAPFHFGWVVEVDPYDPDWVPRKRTALGRFRREGAAAMLSKAGQVVMYSGDDIPFEYIYKFVTREPYDPVNRVANRDLLDDGTLYVARFDHDGTGIWLPLRHGYGPLTEENGFESQGDVVTKTLVAADMLGATRMDRPEDIKASPMTGRVYVTLSNNELRGQDGYLGADSSNPRRNNRHGHIVELRERGDDHGATRFEWDIFMLCGDPADASTYFAGFPKHLVSAVSCPDNLTFDIDGNLWVSTDGQPRTLGVNDGLYAVPVDGPERGYIRRFFSGVPGAEICSPEFTADNRTIFLCVQHPGEGSALPEPTSVGPRGDMPQPSVVVIQENTGGRVGAPRGTGTGA